MQVKTDIVARATRGLYTQDLQVSDNVMLRATRGLYFAEVIHVIIEYGLMCGRVAMYPVITGSTAIRALMRGRIKSRVCR